MFAAIVAGCVPSTKFSGTTHCAPFLSDGDVVLVSALPGDNWELQFAAIKKELGTRGVKVLYAPEEEWTLRAAGIPNPLDTTNYKKLYNKGISHLLLVAAGQYSRGDLYTVKTPHELALELNPFHPYPASPVQNIYKAQVNMHLVSVKTKQLYSFTAETQLSGLEVRHDDGGRSNVNAGSIEQATYFAVKKGTERIVKNCR
jgi:hypothetical protein